MQQSDQVWRRPQILTADGTACDLDFIMVSVNVATLRDKDVDKQRI